MSANPYFKLLNTYPHICCTLWTTFSSNLDYANPSFWISIETLLPCHKWSMQSIQIAIWNTAARLRQHNHNPTRIMDLACDIPEAHWKHKNISNDPVLNACHPMTEIRFTKFEKLPLDYRHIHTLNHSQ